jgi:hypothetical protein
MDLYPEGLHASGIARRGGLAYGLLRRLNDFGLRGTRGVIALGETQLRRLREQKRLPPPDRCIVVPPWDYRPCPRPAAGESRFLARFNPDGKRLAVYAGNLGQARA